MEKKTLKTFFDETLNLDYESLIHNNHSDFDEYITKDDDNYYVQLCLPGLIKDDLKIVVTKDLITISLDKKDYRFVKPFNKKYMLPKDSDFEKITAKLENGICNIIIPKDKIKSGERLVEIE